MLVVRSTRKLAALLGVELREPEAASRAVLGEWYANVVPVLGGNAILFVNSPTRLAVVVPAGERKRVERAFARRLVRLYDRLELPGLFAGREAAEMDRFVYAATRDRSLLGSMNGIARQLEDFVAGLVPGFGASATSFELAMSEMPHGPLGRRAPAEVARQLAATAQRCARLIANR